MRWRGIPTLRFPLFVVKIIEDTIRINSSVSFMSGSSFLFGMLPGITVLGLGLAATVAPLTTAVLAGVEEKRAGIAAAVNTAVSRLAGLLAVALLPLLAGMASADSGSLAAGFGRAMWICAAVSAAAGVCALVTLRR